MQFLHKNNSRTTKIHVITYMQKRDRNNKKRTERVFGKLALLWLAGVSRQNNASFIRPLSLFPVVRFGSVVLGFFI